MRRNTCIDEYAIFWGVVQGGLILTDDLARRILRNTLAAACIVWTVCGVAVGLSLLLASAAWACVHLRDRRALVKVVSGSLRVARTIPVQVVTLVKCADRQVARLICTVVDMIDRERQRWELRQGYPFRVSSEPNHRCGM